MGAVGLSGRLFPGVARFTRAGWAFLELGCLVYEVPRDADGGSDRRSLRLAEWHLRGGASAKSFELHSTVTAVGVRYEVVITLTSASRSAATRLLAACASMQMHTRAEPPLQTPGAQPHGPAGAAERQVRALYSHQPWALYSHQPWVLVVTSLGSS